MSNIAALDDLHVGCEGLGDAGIFTLQLTDNEWEAVLALSQLKNPEMWEKKLRRRSSRLGECRNGQSKEGGSLLPETDYPCNSMKWQSKKARGRRLRPKNEAGSSADASLLGSSMAVEHAMKNGEGSVAVAIRTSPSTLRSSEAAGRKLIVRGGNDGVLVLHPKNKNPARSDVINCSVGIAQSEKVDRNEKPKTQSRGLNQLKQGRNRVKGKGENLEAKFESGHGAGSMSQGLQEEGIDIDSGKKLSEADAERFSILQEENKRLKKEYKMEEERLQLLIKQNMDLKNEIAMKENAKLIRSPPQLAPLLPCDKVTPGIAAPFFYAPMGCCFATQIPSVPISGFPPQFRFPAPFPPSSSFVSPLPYCPYPAVPFTTPFRTEIPWKVPQSQACSPPQSDKEKSSEAGETATVVSSSLADEDSVVQLSPAAEARKRRAATMKEKKRQKLSATS